MAEPRVPFAEPTPAQMERLRELGMPEPINLYRVLANQPDLLRVWVEMAWTLRLAAKTPRRLRELMITRGAEVTECGYEYGHHRRMALATGVSEKELAELGQWRQSGLFSAPERAALAFMEAVLEGSVSDDVAAELARHFDAAERVELALTAGFYAMVPRVIDALAVPPE
jgi:AhpD family alkylhydroperoxidase